MLCRLNTIPTDPAQALDALSQLPCKEKAASLKRVTDALKDTPVYGMLRVDMSTVNDLGYYNGLVFRGYVDGVPERVIAGGQYDPLVRKLGRRGGAVGFAVYLNVLERLQEAQDRPDADVLLLYPDGADASEVLREVRQLNEAGRTVSAQKAVPERLRFGERLILRESGVNGDV
jgi:ATP phosphoribosyltransferase regulatory subunit